MSKNYCFLSNYLTHHQVPFCLEMQKLTNGNFKFIETLQLPEDRKTFGYRELGKDFDFVLNVNESCKAYETAMEIVNTADVVIIGSAPDKFILNRLKQNKLTFRYSERIFKKGYYDVLRQIKYIFKNFLYRNKNLYYLLSSAYAAHDYKRCGVRPEKMFKWGYFPEFKDCQSIDDIIEKKEENSILWAARIIDWKHPEVAIEVAKRLKREGYSFKLNFIGNGEKEDYIKTLIKKYGLENNVFMLGSMSPDKVREQMEKHKIFLFTSDFNEGWGAVLNEAMNSACAVVASHAAGSVPFMIKNGTNGFIYENDDFEALYNYVKSLLDNEELACKMAKEAYKTLKFEWNAENSAKKLIVFCNSFDNKKSFNSNYENGVLSKAHAIHQFEMFGQL